MTPDYIKADSSPQATVAPFAGPSTTAHLARPLVGYKKKERLITATVQSDGGEKPH